MPIGPSVVYKTFKIPCSGEGIFVVVNMELYDACIVYWDGNRYTKIVSSSSVNVADMTVQDGTATVTVSNDSGYYSSTRVCFIPGDPLASS
mgnify:CR=1 FL=1